MGIADIILAWLALACAGLWFVISALIAISTSFIPPPTAAQGTTARWGLLSATCATAAMVLLLGALWHEQWVWW